MTAAMPPGQRRCTCPSARAEPGAVLLGIIGPGQRVAYVAPELRIDDAFVDIAQRGGRRPEQRFRFAATCVEQHCQQWTGARCRVIDDVIDEDAAEHRGAAADESSPLPKCAIRRSCRWFAQRAAAACRTCPTIVTDTTVDLPHGR